MIQDLDRPEERCRLSDEAMARSTIAGVDGMRKHVPEAEKKISSLLAAIISSGSIDQPQLISTVHGHRPPLTSGQEEVETKRGE